MGRRATRASTRFQKPVPRLGGVVELDPILLGYSRVGLRV